MPIYWPYFPKGHNLSTPTVLKLETRAVAYRVYGIYYALNRLESVVQNIAHSELSLIHAVFLSLYALGVPHAPHFLLVIAENFKAALQVD